MPFFTLHSKVMISYEKMFSLVLLQGIISCEQLTLNFPDTENQITNCFLQSLPASLAPNQHPPQQMHMLNGVHFSELGSLLN